ncbi:phospholipase effector Tle1 domain-containing protein [Teredinibacter purpureus]|uniref:phospholipase effector Tle1 domain-containing protein n=1 Tax=Teredinibacter purpureus TaxID=2731756 RepID=UPI0005F81A63|nr:DUF2235 domain-containing protein [Teredinibacter purpureus]
MPKILYFNFDGTNNAPEDAVQDKNHRGDPEDNGITNVLKFHLLLGGTLKEKTGSTSLEGGSRTFYYHGIGTYGNFFERKFNAGLAANATDVKKIIRLALADFNEHYSESCDYVVLTGFSRGAALARRFAALINDLVGDRKIIIEGVFDTVASIGIPNLSKKDRPKSEVVFEFNHTLPSNVLTALHLVSLDDKRKAFQPTLMNKDDRVTEIWFAGAHSDVGGGYNFDGLSDGTLRFFLNWFEDLPNCNIAFKSPANIQYEHVFKKGAKQKIGMDDVQIDPNVFGVNHQQSRAKLISKVTLTDRVCCVIEDNIIKKNATPTLHESVAERIGGDRNYRPESLRNTAHNIVYNDGETKAFVGFSEHKLAYKKNLRLPTSEGVETKIFAHLHYNHTGVVLKKGEKYRLKVVRLQEKRWRDAGLKPVDGEGWSREDADFNFFKNAAFSAAESFKRVTGPNVQWFTLCGCIGENEKEAFKIGNELECFEPLITGELCAFANDLPGYYGNNSGYLYLSIEKL